MNFEKLLDNEFSKTWNCNRRLKFWIFSAHTHLYFLFYLYLLWCFKDSDPIARLKADQKKELVIKISTVAKENDSASA